MGANRFLIVGLGIVGRELVERLSREYGLTCIDLNPESSDFLEAIKREDLKLIAGDATSRLVLEEAKAGDHDAVIITTTEEKVNLEVARLLKDNFPPLKVISIALTQKGSETLDGMGVEVVNLFAAGALGIRNLIEHKVKAAHAIGLGKNEILEVEVHPNSRLANKPLGALKPIGWRTGIVYREGNIIVPRPDIVLKPKDKVVILGEPGMLRTVSEVLTFSYETFPLEYGNMAVIYIGTNENENFVDEIDYFMTTFPVENFLVVYSEYAKMEKYEKIFSKIEPSRVHWKKSMLPSYGAIMGALDESPGRPAVILVSGNFLKSRGLFFRSQSAGRMMRELVKTARCPVFVARGTFPYEKTAVPCLPGGNVENVIQTALEISSSINNKVTAFHIKPSRYIAGEEEMGDFEEIKKSVSSMGLMYKAKIESIVLEGNPVKATLSVLKDYNLLLAEMEMERSFFSSFLNPDVVWHVISGANVSTFVLPRFEESI